MLKLETLMDISETLAQLDPVRTYPQRAAQCIADAMGTKSYFLDCGERVSVRSQFYDADMEPTTSVPLRAGRDTLGTLHLQFPVSLVPSQESQQHLRWAARIMGRGLTYCERLVAEGGRRAGEALAQTLKRSPLTPRERDVVSLLVSGASTRDIASRTGLTVSTVNTYLKRIFSKLGVHSRVELVARMAGTDGIAMVRDIRSARTAPAAD